MCLLNLKISSLVIFLRISLTFESLKEILINLWKLICVKAVQEVSYTIIQVVAWAALK